MGIQGMMGKKKVSGQIPRGYKARKINDNSEHTRGMSLHHVNTIYLVFWRCFSVSSRTDL